MSPAAATESESYDGASAEEEYNNIDTDKDGKLSRQEIEAFYSAWGQENAVPDEFWQELDRDGDGFISMEASTVAHLLATLLAFIDAFSLSLPQLIDFFQP